MPSSRLDVATSPFRSTRLELVLDLQPALPTERSVVRLHQLLLHGRVALGLGGSVLALPVQLVESGGEALGQPAGVHEDQGGAVLLHQLEQSRVHGRPDGVPHRSGRRGTRRRLVDDGAELGHVVDRDDDLDLERLAHARVDDGDGARPALTGGRSLRATRGTGRSPPAGAGWPTGRCAVALAAARRTQWSSRSRVSGEVAAALGGGQRVDLVDDHGFDTPQRLPRSGGEHQVEGLRGGDQDVGRVPDQQPALVGRCVAGAHADGRLRVGQAQSLRSEADPLQRGCAGSSRRRRPAPGAVIRRAAACGGCGRREPVGSRACRCPTGRRSGSCPNRWGRGSACAHRSRWPANPVPAAAWRQGTRRGTTRARPARRARADPWQPPRHATDGR